MTLPAFLLAYTNSNLVWLGFKKHALPAVTARWSLGRFVAQVAIKTALAVLLGGLISLVLAGQPLGWLMWLLGVFAACQSIVMEGLTALCWNRRALRLNQNPALPIGLPPARYRLARWALGFVYFVVLALVTPLAMLLTVENVYGELAWRRERARLVAQGERLTFREILGPEIPAAENAGAAPIFQPLFDYPRGRAVEFPRGSSPESSDALARIKARLEPPYSFLPEKPRGGPPTPKQPENMADWSEAYRKLAASPSARHLPWAAELKLPPPGNPARDVLAGLAVSDAVMSEICAAAALPRAQFPVHLDKGLQLNLSHVLVLKSAQLNLRVRCAAHLAAGETDAAFAAATNALNVAELLREEPLLSSQFVRIAQGLIALDTLWQGFPEHHWSDAQLAVFQERLGRVDYLPGLIRAFEGERVLDVEVLEKILRNPTRIALDEDGTGFRLPTHLIPYGMVRQNQVALVRMYTELLTALRSYLSETTPRGLASFLTALAMEERLQRMASSPFTLFAKMLISALPKAQARAALVQTSTHLAIMACALERYRLAHGSYPETLDQLVPTFLPKPVLDPMTAQPFHYRRTDDGWFLLYSVGLDGQDDGGVFRDKPKGPIKDWPWPVPTRPKSRSLF